MHWWGRRNKQPDTGQANSGLTGDPALEQPPVPEGPKDLRGRWDNLKQSVTGTTAALPRVLRLVWDASPSTTLGLFATTAIAGIIPAAAAYTAKLLINSVVLGIAIHSFHQPDRESFAQVCACSPIGPLQQLHFTAVGMIVALAIVQLALFALTALLGTIRNITQQLLQNSVAMRIQLMVMEKAASLDLQFYEDPASYDLLRRAQTDRRRNRQIAYNAERGITPETVIKAIYQMEINQNDLKADAIEIMAGAGVPREDLLAIVRDLEKEMRRLSKELQFEDAARVRDRIILLRKRLSGEVTGKEDDSDVALAIAAAPKQKTMVRGYRGRRGR